MKKYNKEIKRYDFTQKPRKPSKVFMGLIKFFALNPVIAGLGFKCEKVNMEGIKPPYFLLCNHASKMDHRLLLKSIKPYNMNYVIAIDSVHYRTIRFTRLTGCIVKRKFVQDFNLIRNMKYCVENYGTPLVVYPEARYSFDGTPNYVPPSLGKMAKLLKVPLVIGIFYGNFICMPQWNKGHFYARRPHVESKLKCIATAEEVQTLSAEELNRRIQENFVYDDFKYQYDNKISLKYKKRAKGLHHILYQCCECGAEFEMYSYGTTLECRHCGKKWNMTEYGRLEAYDGNTRFPHIPDWFKWERGNVKREVEQGTYLFEDEVEVYNLPKNKYFSQGKGKFRQDMTGTYFSCNYYGEPLEMHFTPNELDSIQIDFDHRGRSRKQFFGDCVSLSNADDSFWLHPINVRGCIMKISFAAEELHILSMQKLKNGQKTIAAAAE
ncbi:MAG: hypothetical protein LUD27_02570 [Clostridia bacterium]|nr:hypothetical protein [Clostridia bacterium]